MTLEHLKNYLAKHASRIHKDSEVVLMMKIDDMLVQISGVIMGSKDETGNHVVMLGFIVTPVTEGVLIPGTQIPEPSSN